MVTTLYRFLRGGYAGDRARKIKKRNMGIKVFRMEGFQEVLAGVGQSIRKIGFHRRAE